MLWYSGVGMINGLGGIYYHYVGVQKDFCIRLIYCTIRP